MRAPGPPVRFLIAVIGLWVAGRIVVLSRGGEERAQLASAPPAAHLTPSPLRKLGPMAPSSAAVAAVERDRPLPAQGRRASVEGERPLSSPPIGLAGRPTVADARPTSIPARAAPADSPAPRAALAPEPPAGLDAAPPPLAAASRWSGSAFLFARGGGGAVPLAGGGQLGGSQAGARVSYRLDAAGRLAAAARIYVPVERVRGAEAAVGIDLRPLPTAPLRLSLERRIAIGRGGRDAWSAYAAGGFFRALAGAIELDGYAQAGVVGAKRRDLFADGALRIGRTVDLGGGAALVAGAGAWGAAQPGAARLDLGPRTALRLPVADVAVSIAGEWRVRVAGEARPRSGPALTIAADF